MSKFVIKGGKKIEGKVSISGSKNAILALLPASLLIDGRVIFKNVPRIRDVETMIKIMNFLGAEIIFENNNLIIDTKNISYRDLLIPEIKSLRASILFLGPMLAKFGKIRIYLPGGDVIGARPIDTHLKALTELGVKFKIKGDIIEGKFNKFKNFFLILKESSVTATEALIMFSALSKKEVNLRLVALEPHIQALCHFLSFAGYNLQGIGTNFLKIKKGSRLKKEVIFKIPSDYLEIGTFIALAGAARSKIIIEDVNFEELDAVFLLMKEMNFNFELKSKNIYLKPSILKGTKIQTGLYPKFATDLHPPFGVMATQAQGVTLIHEWMYENRFGYLRELSYMGANVEILDPHRAIIIGSTPLQGREVKSLDIRSGISLIIAGLIANGETIIHEAEKIDRGYENIEEKLTNLGADIKRVFF